MKRFLFGLVVAVLLVAPGCAKTAPASAAEKSSPVLTAFLVRHAEKQLEVSDPELTQEGTARANDLARILADANITRILSSDYARTRATAAPLAAALGLDVELYDPRDLAALVQNLKTEGGRVLVAGHSNTIPETAELLGGEPGAEIVEATEYDRLYIVSIAENGEVTSVLLRYGAANAD